MDDVPLLGIRLTRDSWPDDYHDLKCRKARPQRPRLQMSEALMLQSVPPYVDTLLIDVFHRLTATLRALKLRHATPVFTTELGSADHHVNDHFIDQILCAANLTAIQVLLRRWPKGPVKAFPRRGLVAGLSHIVPF